MRLADVVAAGVPSIFAEVALVVFFLTFLGASAYALARRNRVRFDHAARLPFEDGTKPSQPEATR